MAAPKKLTDEQREEVRRLNKAGQSYAALAARYNVSFNTILRICRPEVYEDVKKKNLEISKRGSSTERFMKTRKETQKRYELVLSKTADEHLIDFLSTKESVNGYLKQLVQDDYEYTHKESDS